MTLLVPRHIRGVAPPAKLHAPRLVTGTPGTRIHRRRRRSQSLIYKELDFNASILRTSFARRVLRNGLHFTIAIRRNNSSQWDIVVLDQVTNDGISTTLAQRTI